MTEDIRPYRLMDLIKDTEKLIRDTNFNMVEINSLFDELCPNNFSVKLINVDGEFKLYYKDNNNVYSPINRLIDDLNNSKYYG